MCDLHPFHVQLLIAVESRRELLSFLEAADLSNIKSLTAHQYCNILFFCEFGAAEDFKRLPEKEPEEWNEFIKASASKKKGASEIENAITDKLKDQVVEDEEFTASIRLILQSLALKEI